MVVGAAVAVVVGCVWVDVEAKVVEADVDANGVVVVLTTATEVVMAEEEEEDV